jgi:hypothetical protein
LIAAASPVAPVAPAREFGVDGAHDPDDGDTEAYAEGEAVIGTTPLEWTPVHVEDQVEDMPAWLTVLRTEKAPDSGVETGFDQPIERADDPDDQPYTPARTGTATKWSPEPPPTVTLNLASAPTGPAPVPTSVPASEPPIAATSEDNEPLEPPTPAIQSAVMPDIQEMAPSLPARKKAHNAKTPKPKLSTEDLLDMAHKALETDDFEGAADYYALLVKAGKKLDVLLAEIDAAAQAHPKVRRFHRLLGDVYMRKGDVNAALIAYHRALETTE